MVEGDVFQILLVAGGVQQVGGQADVAPGPGQLLAEPGHHLEGRLQVGAEDLPVTDGGAEDFPDELRGQAALKRQVDPLPRAPGQGQPPHLGHDRVLVPQEEINPQGFNPRQGLGQLFQAGPVRDELKGPGRGGVDAQLLVEAAELELQEKPAQALPVRRPRAQRLQVDLKGHLMGQQHQPVAEAGLVGMFGQLGPEALFLNIIYMREKIFQGVILGDEF